MSVATRAPLSADVVIVNCTGDPLRRCLWSPAAKHVGICGGHIGAALRCLLLRATTAVGAVSPRPVSVPDVSYPAKGRTDATELTKTPL